MSMTVDQVYGLAHGQIWEEVIAIDNPFIRQLASLALDSSKQLKVVSFVLKDKVNNRGEIQQRGISAAEKSVIDICKLTPLVGAFGSRTLLEEIANYRMHSLGFDTVRPSFAKDNAEMLMVDYLLASCLCYVEVFDDNSSRVDKYFATRNRFIAGSLAGLAPQETAKYLNYLQVFPANFDSRQLKVLKMGILKNGFKISQPRSYVDFNKSIKITPLFLMMALNHGISETLQNNIVRFRYIKDNLTEREFITTLSPQILLKYYDHEMTQRMLSGVGVQMNRGYIRLPELGISKYDDTGVRALNLSRITSVEVINEFDTRYIDVDFSLIMANFMETVDSINNLQLLQVIHEDLLGKPAQTANPLELRGVITSFVESQHAIGTTTALRFLHNYMVSRSNIFKAYHGGKPLTFGSYTDSFNLGGAE